MTADEILDCCAEGYRLGFRTFVLQGGEDAAWSDERLVRLIGAIRKEAPAQSEIFEEVPIAQESAEIVEETAPEVLEEVTEETAPEVLEEVTEETAPEVLEEVTEEPIEETAKEAPAEAAEETPEEPAVPTEEQEENIRMLQRLLDAGVLTREEFEAKKNDILKA